MDGAALSEPGMRAARAVESDAAAALRAPPARASSPVAPKSGLQIRKRPQGPLIAALGAKYIPFQRKWPSVAALGAKYTLFRRKWLFLAVLGPDLASKPDPAGGTESAGGATGPQVRSELAHLKAVACGGAQA